MMLALARVARRHCTVMSRRQSHSPRHAGPLYAALDLGTNNCRLLVAAPAGDGFRVVDSFNRVVRLGEGLHHTGRIAPAAVARALAALGEAAEHLARHDLRALRAVATEACRRAGNGGEFLARARAETGQPLAVISTREEAELAVESCAPLLRRAGRRALLFDIGGGSTELAWVRLPTDGGTPELAGYVSLPIGVVTLAERCGADCLTETGFDRLVTEVEGLLLPFEATHRIGQEIRQGGVRLMGTSGTVTTLAGVVLGLARYRRPLVDGVLLNGEATDAALDSLCRMGRAGLLRHPCVGPERADYVLPGCAIFAAIRRLWPTPQIGVADRGLREGMLLRLIRADRTRPVRPRRHASHAMAPQP